MKFRIEYKQDNVVKTLNIQAPDKQLARDWFDIETVKYPGVVEFVNVEEYNK